MKKTRFVLNKDSKIRWGWLKGMYLYTVIGSGGFGLGIILFPEYMRTAFGWPSQDPIVYGVTGSVYLAFAFMSVFGLKAPLKFVPILMLQLCYKSIWMIGVILPMVIFSSYIVGDLIAIPFKNVISDATFKKAVAADR